MAKAGSEGSTVSPSLRDSSGVEDRSSTRSQSSKRLLRRTSTEYFGDVSRALLPGPPRLVTTWMKQATQAKTVKQTVHARTQGSDRPRRFTSQHHDGYVWPIHDVVANEILMWLLPTQMLTHLIKFTVVLLGLLFSLLFCIWYERTDYHRTDDGLDIEGGYAAPINTDFGVTMVLVACQRYWPNFVAGFCFLCIPMWIYWMYQTTLYALGKPWMDPRLPSVNRLEMHVPMRFYTSVRTARQGACHIELVSRDTKIQEPSTSDALDENSSRHPIPYEMGSSCDAVNAESINSGPSFDCQSTQSLAPNVMNLDGPDWKFQLLPTVEQAMHVVYQDELSNDDNLHSSDSGDWSQMIVPSNWMFSNGKVPFDKPIYTNQRYVHPRQSSISTNRYSLVKRIVKGIHFHAPRQSFHGRILPVFTEKLFRSLRNG